VLEIGTPALVITGADDQLIPPSESETLAQGLQDSRLEILPNAGHLSNLEQPELFNGAVKDYLRTML
jgi:pimeloyl-ACP methyl ester carboxylesterase